MTMVCTDLTWSRLNMVSNDETGIYLGECIVAKHTGVYIICIVVYNLSRIVGNLR